MSYKLPGSRVSYKMAGYRVSNKLAGSKVSCKLAGSRVSVLLLMKKDLSLSCKASRKALLPRLLRTDVRMRLTALQLANSLIVSTTGY